MLTREQEKALRRSLVLKALHVLETDVDKQTVFEEAVQERVSVS
jgi:hypothetical protein